MGEIFVSTIFCDDVRLEHGGKQSFMGVYNSEMILPSFPITLPKLCAQISIRFPIDTKANNVAVTLSNGDDIIAQVPIPDGELQRMSKVILANDEAPDEVVFLGVLVHLQLTPLQLDQQSKIRSYATIDGIEVKGNSLIARLPTSAERTALGLPD